MYRKSLFKYYIRVPTLIIHEENINLTFLNHSVIAVPVGDSIWDRYLISTRPEEYLLKRPNSSSLFFSVYKPVLIFQRSFLSLYLSTRRPEGQIQVQRFSVPWKKPFSATRRWLGYKKHTRRRAVRFRSVAREALKVRAKICQSYLCTYYIHAQGIFLDLERKKCSKNIIINVYVYRRRNSSTFNCSVSKRRTPDSNPNPTGLFECRNTHWSTVFVQRIVEPCSVRGREIYKAGFIGKESSLPPPSPYIYNIDITWQTPVFLLPHCVSRTTHAPISNTHTY